MVLPGAAWLGFEVRRPSSRRGDRARLWFDQNQGSEAVKSNAARRIISLLALAVGSAAAQSQDEPPSWAYPVNPPNFQRAPDDGSIRRVPGSTAGFTLTQVRDLFAAPDWHPEDHSPMPSVVANGRKPEVMACGVCHRADGAGGPENASLFGLPAAYIVQQTKTLKMAIGMARRLASPMI
jgi:cytochrome c553